MNILDKALSLKTLAYLQITLGVISLIHEIRDFTRLPTMKEVELMYGGCVDLIKYKDTTYITIPLAILLIFSGISYWIDSMFYKVISVVSLVSFLLYITDVWRLIYYNIIFSQLQTPPPF